jgi:Ricin-type beta-trefoil lectin domain-like
VHRRPWAILAATLLAGAAITVVRMSDAGAATAATTLVVNANSTLRPVTHVASGSLYGLADDATPADQYVTPMHPNTFVQMAAGGHQQAKGDINVVAAKAARDGAKVVDRLSDYYAGWPYQFSWSNWLTVVDQQVANVRPSNLAAYELWNEPDGTWQSANGTFNDFWVKTYREVRAHDSTTPIQGPSFSDNISGMQSFLQNAVATNTVPDVIAWHELSNQSKIAGDISTVTNLEKSLGITPRPIDIEEYAAPSQVGVPGALVGYIAKFERLGVTRAEMAFWNGYGALGDTLTGTGGTPNGAWYLYKWYGDMSGNMLQTVAPAQTGIDGAAAYDSSTKTLSVIVGGGSGDSAVTINGLSSLSGFGSTVNVKLEYTPSPGRTVAVSGPTTISQQSYTVSNGTITVPIAGMNSAYGYHVVVTAGSGSTTPPPTGLSGTYKIANVNSGLVLGIQNASTSSGAAALQWTDTGAADHVWSLVDTGSGNYRIVNQNSGLVLGVAGGSTAAGAAVQQLSDTGATSQRWQFVSTGSGQYKIKNVNSGLLLGITNASTSAGATALQWSDNGTADHLWTLTATGTATGPVTSGATYTVANKNSGLNLDTQNSGTAQGTLAVQASASSSNTQGWTFNAVSGTNYYKIVNKASGLLLGIQNASTSAGANALIWGDNGTNDHLWSLVANGDGTYKIVNANSGLLLGITNASTSSGAIALQWSDNGTADHLWRLTQR